MEIKRFPPAVRGVLACACLAVAAAQSPQQYAVSVNGTPVVTTRPAVRVAGEWFVPLAPVAKTLGAELSIDPPSQSIRILRSDGTVANYEGTTGRILQGLVMAGSVKNFRDVQLNAGVENVLFPVTGVVALLGVTVREDPERDMLEIESLSPSAAGPASSSSFHPASLDYRSGLATNGEVWQQLLDLHGEALFDGRRVSANLELSEGTGAISPAFRQGSIRVELDPRRTVTVGDRATYAGLDALNNTVRGLTYEWLWGQFKANAYGGLGASSTSSALGNAGLANYDAQLAGFGLRRKFATSNFSLAANFFHGTQRSGLTFGTAYSGTYIRNQYKLQALLGDFSGYSLRPRLELATIPLGGTVEVDQTAQHVEGAAYGFSVADSFTPLKSNKFWLTGLWERYSRNFLVLREDASYSAVSRTFLSSVLQPSRYIGFTGAVRDSTALLGSPDLGRGYTYGMNASTPGSTLVQFAYFRSVQFGGGLAGRFGLSQYSVQLPHLSRFMAAANYSEIRFNGQLARTVNETLSADFKRLGRLGLHDQLQLHSGNDYGIDWSRQFGNEGAYLLAGLERQTARNQTAIFAPTAAVRIPLPRKQSLTFSYIGLRGSRQLQFQIGGPLLRPRELLKTDGRMILIVQSSLIGQVYQDVNQDGKFEAGTDRPLAQLQVWLDEEHSSPTDSTGYFRFDGVSPGTHRVRASIANLPASLMLANEDVMVAVMPYRANRQDILAFQSGQIRGRVTLTKVNDAGKEVDEPYPDARIIVNGDRDTFSEVGGIFILADLPRGMYTLRLDPKTLPAGFVGKPALRTVQVKPGETVPDVDFQTVRPVIIKTAPPNP